MVIRLEDIPGLSEAIKRENDVRDAAFLDLTTDICGISIRQMTPRDFIILDGVGDPLLNGGLPTPRELAQFLWLLSPKYKPNAPIRAWLFARRCRRLPYISAVNRCLKYISETFQDSPGGSASNERQFAGWCAHLVDNIAREYGWDEQRILQMPLKRLFQYRKCIRRWHDPKSPVHNPSDKKVGEYMRLRNARRDLLNLLNKRRLQS